jgi:6-phosphogluconolactonase (cycloisomerase 2 family)
MYRFKKQIWLTAALLLTLTACGGGGGGGDTVVTTSATTSVDVFDGAAIGCSVSSDGTIATEVGDGAYTFATVLDAGTVVTATGCTDTDTQSLLPALSGVVQSGAVVISPITTLIVEAAIANDVAAKGVGLRTDAKSISATALETAIAQIVANLGLGDYQPTDPATANYVVAAKADTTGTGTAAKAMRVGLAISTLLKSIEVSAGTTSNAVSAISQAIAESASVIDLTQSTEIEAVMIAAKAIAQAVATAIQSASDAIVPIIVLISNPNGNITIAIAATTRVSAFLNTANETTIADTTAIIAAVTEAIAANTPPDGFAYTVSSASYTTNIAIVANTPSSTGGAVVSYAVSPTLPTGLSLDTITGEISGIPTTITGINSYTVTATNTVGSTNTIVSIAVNDVVISGLTYTTSSVSYTTNFAISPNTPDSSGGAVVSYAVSPALPAGLSLDTATGEITGTTTTVSGTTSYTVTATNSGGSTDIILSITVSLPSPRFAYVSTAGGYTSIYSVDAVTGQLRARGKTATYGDSLTIGPSGQFAYATHPGLNLVRVFSINASTGALTEESSVTTGTNPSPVTIDPTGQFAFLTYNGLVIIYNIDSSTGALTEGLNPIGTGTTPIAVTVDPTGQFVYVVNFTSNDVSAYRIEAASSQLSFVGTVPAGVEPTAIAVDPSGQYAYVTNGGSDTVSMYSIDSSTGALMGQGFIGTDNLPVSITIDPTGRFAYVANSNPDSPGAGTYSVSVYSLNTGAVNFGDLTWVETVAAGTEPEYVTIDPSGQFAYVANKGSSNISIYNVNASTGALTPLAASSKMITGNSPTSIAISKGATSLSYVPKFTYAVNNVSNTVSTYRFFGNTTTHAAVALPTGSTEPVSIAVDPAGEFAYVTNQNGGSTGTVTVYSINASHGGLTFVKTEGLIETELSSVVVDPSGQFIYVLSDQLDQVFSFLITDDGTFGSGSSTATGLDPSFLAIDPSGKFAYVANSGSDTISMYSIDTSTGALTGQGSVEAGNSPSAIAIAPSGQFAYVIGTSSSEVLSYTINNGTGALAQTAAIDTGVAPLSIAIDPSGQFAYVTSRAVTDVDPGYVSVYNINASNGFLTANSTSELGAGVNPGFMSITVDPSGQFVYVAERFPGNFSDKVSVYKINAISGGLTKIATPVFDGDGPQSIITVGGLVDVDIKKKYQIGDTGPAGGTVFYVTALGDHGLEAAPGDLNNVSWGCSSTPITGADGTAIGTGAQNTANILAECTELSIAAELAHDYSFNGIDDWFLPSKNELNEMYINRGVVGGFASYSYWSSSQYNSDVAWAQHFVVGVQPALYNKIASLRVRAVRAF